MQELAPGEAAKDVWALLTGYDFRSPDRTLSDLPGSLRWLLEPLKSEHDWRRAVTQYRGLPQQLRMFDIVDLDAPAVPREVGGRAFREERYRAELARLPAHRTEDPAVAESGKRHRVRRTGASVVIPPGLVATSPPCHRTGRRRRVPRFTWAALERMARVMDGIDAKLGLKNDWTGRVEDLRLFVIGPSKPRPSRQLRLQDVLHVVGMPAVGKTTLITVASVLLAAAPRRHNLTLILGDVVAVMNMVRDLERYGVSAAPILGSASRGRHLQQLHRPSDPTVRGLPLLADERMKWVSTACTLQGLLELSRPWALVDAPCDRGLEPWSDHDDATEPAIPPQPCSCPLVGSCGRHTAARALVKANVWVATAPSLLHCRVPGQLSDQALRYLELAWARSDAFFVDEADRVQIQWDQAFSPSQTLAGPGRDAWLDEVRPMFERHIRDTKGRDLTSSPVRDWSVTISVAALVLARLRHLMAEHAHVREWLSEGYFNEWRLSLRLAVEIARRPGPSGAGGGNWTTDDPCRKQWQHSFGEWMRKPDDDYSGPDDRVAMLCRLSSRLGDSPESVTKALRDWLATLPDVTVGDGQPLERLAVRFHVTILIALLAGKLDLLTRACWEVENETGLESMSTSLVHRPPAEYSPLVPESPMGNLLGFQYREYDTDTTESQLGTHATFPQRVEITTSGHTLGLPGPIRLARGSWRLRHAPIVPPRKREHPQRLALLPKDL